MAKLAIDGGAKVQRSPSPKWPQFDRRTDAAVLDVLHSGRVNYWTGLRGREFEKAWGEWLGPRS